jgi:hypothetical protein
MVSECCAREPQKKETPARTQGFLENQIVTLGEIDLVLRMSDPTTMARQLL